MDKLFVTRTFVPGKGEFQSKLDIAFDNSWLTNNGPLVKELHEKLSKELEQDFLSVLSNGTLAIQLVLKTLKSGGEIITTPFSYVATTNAILWEGFEPVFADIDPDTFCIDPEKVREKITDQTCAILATHVFGVPCDVAALERIGKENNIPVIYDAAHAFGVKLNGKNVLSYGDYSTLSFHATKLFHCGEGGAVICSTPQALDQIDLMKSFGHKGDTYFGLGINAKMSELHAAMGLAVLPHVPELIESRRERSLYYDEALNGLAIQFQIKPEGLVYNYSYYPIVVKSAEAREELIARMEEQNIYPRRYFYPSLNQLPHHTGEPCPNSEDIASRILCLPLFHDLTQEDQDRVIEQIRKTL